MYKMTKECKTHNWKALYYRKKEKEESSQKWIKINNYKICDKCLKIVSEEVKEIGTN